MSKKISESVDAAIRTNRMEGQEISLEARALLEQVRCGEITLEKYEAAVLNKYLVKSSELEEKVNSKIISEADLEKNLPRYLQHDIEQLIKCEKPSLWDCYWGELYASINSAEVDLEITKQQATFLRQKYLYGEEKQNVDPCEKFQTDNSVEVLK